MCTCHSNIQVTRWLLGVCSLLLLCGFWEANANHQAWWQTPPSPAFPLALSLFLLCINYICIYNFYSEECMNPWLPVPLCGRVLEHLSSLAREVSLDYERSMNKINFDQIVSSKPDTFSYVTLPQKEEEKVPDQGERQRTLAAHLASSPTPISTLFLFSH